MKGGIAGLMVGLLVAIVGVFVTVREEAVEITVKVIEAYCQAAESDRMKLRTALSTPKGPLAEIYCENLEDEEPPTAGTDNGLKIEGNTVVG